MPHCPCCGRFVKLLYKRGIDRVTFEDDNGQIIMELTGANLVECKEHGPMAWATVEKEG